MNMRIIRLLLLPLLLVTLLSACSNKPKDVSQEVWDNGIQATLYIDNKTSNQELIDTAIFAKLTDDVNSLTDEEREIYKDVINLSKKSLEYYIVTIEDGTGDIEKNEYDKQFKTMEKTFGKSSLKQSNFNEALISNELTVHSEELDADNEDKKKEFMRKHGAEITGKDVQYDLVNNLDKSFYLEGTIELCDYYNYGYTNEKSNFCGLFTPLDGGYSDSWYLYLNRETFEPVYKALMNGIGSDLRIIAKVPSGVYKKGQGNMALVEFTVGY